MNRFRVEVPGIARSLFSPIAIFPPFPADTKKEDWPRPLQIKAVWDTGATHTVITKKIIDQLSLEPTGKTTAHGVHATNTVNTYLVHILLPNQLIIPTVRVLEGSMSGIDVLIGMDIISKGDFVVSNAKGKTIFEFGMPAKGITLAKRLSNEFGNGVKVPRNLAVKIKNHKSQQTKDGKYKDFEEELKSEDWHITEILKKAAS